MELRRTPRALAERLERRRVPPAGGGERFLGYGVLGLPFASGHVLAFRRVVSSSVGPPCMSVWHRDPAGRWTFYVDAEPTRSCPRYWGAAIDRLVVGEVRVAWTETHTLSIRIPEHRLHWGVRLGVTPLTRTLDAAGLVTPDLAWNSPAVLTVVGRLAGWALGAGRVELVGRLPNGQAYRLRPLSLWSVEGSAAVVEGKELGRTGPLEVQASLGTVPVPNRGLFVVGRSFHEPFDPLRHATRTTREGGTPAQG